MLSARQEQLQAPTRSRGPPEGVGRLSQGEVRLPGSQGRIRAHAQCLQQPAPTSRTLQPHMKFRGTTACPVSAGMENEVLWVNPRPTEGFFLGCRGHCVKNKRLAEVGRRGFGWKGDVHGEVWWLQWFMDVGGVSNPHRTRSASVLGMVLLPPHPKFRSPWLSPCTQRGLVVCGLLSPTWEAAGKSNQGCGKG